jgi:hypothetical protein
MPPMRKLPKHLSGSVPGKDFVNTGDVSGIKIGLVTRVDEVNMKADLKILSSSSERYEIDLTQGMAGPRSFWGGVPEVNSLAVVGYRRIHKQLHEAVILGYLPVGNRAGLRFDPFSPENPAEIDAADKELFEQVIGTTSRIKRLLLRPGDVGGMSASGSEIALSTDVRMVNRAGDSLELRDSDRTFISHTIHRVESDAGVKRVSGPIRRGSFFLPADLLRADGKTLKDASQGYYGRDILMAAGPGVGVGSSAKFSNTKGQLLDVFNDGKTFPPVVYSNGRQVHYPPTSPAVNFEDPDNGADTFVEDRFEMSHTSDLSQEVIEEIDGFTMDRRPVYIERVLGTVVGNDTSSTRGQRQYGKLLKPKLFPDFLYKNPGKFTLEEVDRQPTAPDLEAVTSAGAMLFRLRPPRGTGDNDFVAALNKQGKLFLNIPGSTVEDYPSGAKKISLEANLEGALKAFIGASNPDRVSVHMTLEGGVHLDIGRDAQGNALTIRYHSATKTIYEGNPNEDDVTTSIDVRGVKESNISGAERKVIEGSKRTIVSGLNQMNADRYNVNAFQGASFNYGELNQLVSGKTQLNHALQVLENIALGGKISTILAGGLTQTVVAGAIAYSALAGAISFAAPAGAFSVTVGAGALSLTTGAGAVTLSTAAGALSLAAGGGAVAITAGLAMNLAASTLIALTAPQVLLGSPTAAFGVVRGVAALPPGAPSLDPITGTPLLGSALVRSI